MNHANARPRGAEPRDKESRAACRLADSRAPDAKQIELSSTLIPHNRLSEHAARCGTALEPSRKDAHETRKTNKSGGWEPSPPSGLSRPIMRLSSCSWDFVRLWIRGVSHGAGALTAGLLETRWRWDRFLWRIPRDGTLSAGRGGGTGRAAGWRRESGSRKGWRPGGCRRATSAASR